MKETAIFTISSNNYYAFSKTLLESVSKHHDDADLYYLIADEPFENDRNSEHPVFETVYVKDIGLTDYLAMAFVYDQIEFNTSIKPFFIDYLFKKGYAKVIYLDPDIFVFNRLDDALEKLEKHSVVVTPHQLYPVEPLNGYVTYIHWEQSSLECGIFNLGFIGVSNSPEGKSFVEWWSNRCRYMCFMECSSGLYFDQKWIDLALAYFPSIHILRHEGYNMAVWNIHSRVLSNDDEQIVNDKFPLVFYHFSAIDLANDDVLSNHDKSLSIFSRPDLHELYAMYREKVIGNSHIFYSNIPYAYCCFSDGNRIELIERRMFINISNKCLNPFSYTKYGFCKALILNINSKSDSNHSIVNSIFISLIRILYFMIGPRKYSYIFNYFNGKNGVRNHLFLFN